MKLRLGLILIFSVLSLHAEDSLRIAASANLTHALPALTEAFQSENPGIRVETSFGASGSLVAQITHGAPYDVFLSADMDYPRALIKAGQADKESLAVFAVGQLVLWTTRPGLDPADAAGLLQSDAVRKLAIANPDTAPYGRAARQVLQRLGLWDDLKTKLVIGENISQTAQFVDSGNADAGFVALSIVLAPKLAERGKWMLLDASWHESLEQGAVLTNRGATNPAAARFLAFLQSPAAREIFKRYGYGLPQPDASL